MSLGEPRKVGTRWCTPLGCRLWIGSVPAVVWNLMGYRPLLGGAHIYTYTYTCTYSVLTRDGLAARLLHDEAHGRGLVQEAELPIGILLVGGVAYGWGCR